MIAPMKRVFLLMSEKERRNAARKLRSLGLVHLEPLSGTGETWQALAEECSKLESALAILSDYGPQPGEEKLGQRDALDLAEHILKLQEDIKQGYEKAAALSQEIERVRPWGDFDPDALRSLAAGGLSLRLATIPIKHLAALCETHDVITLSRVKSLARVALLAEPQAELPQDALEFRPPEASLSTLSERLATIKSGIKADKEAIALYAPNQAAMRAVMDDLSRDLQLETYRSGAPAESGVLWYSGWVPAKEAPALEKDAARFGWAIILDEPKEEEQPPTKIENNALVRIVQPIFDFMGTVPNYREYDISAWFLLFFGLFFAMIFGDAGYGSLMLGLVGVFALRSKLKKGRVPDGLKLFLFLSSLTVLWGGASGSWFGLTKDALPSFLADLALEPIAMWNPDSTDNIKVLCFILGGVHLAIAHIKNILRDFPKPKFIGQVGSLMLVVGMYYLVLNLVVSAAKFPIPAWSLYMIGIGFSLSFIFGSWETGPIQSILDSLKNIISIFLGTVSFFADIVSYIRLWAVGLAGVAISQTVNGMASPLMRIPLALVFGVLILFIGHGLNLVMGALSVVVHGMRLNLLEFSGHMGMEWSGYQYQPFKDTAGEKTSA